MGLLLGVHHPEVDDRRDIDWVAVAISHLTLTWCKLAHHGVRLRRCTVNAPFLILLCISLSVPASWLFPYITLAVLSSSVRCFVDMECCSAPHGHVQ